MKISPKVKPSFENQTIPCYYQMSNWGIYLKGKEVVTALISYQVKTSSIRL